jgi:hypothetical protein
MSVKAALVKNHNHKSYQKQDRETNHKSYQKQQNQEPNHKSNQEQNKKSNLKSNQGLNHNSNQEQNQEPKKPNRKRNVHFHLWATEEEAALIRKRMADAGITSLGAYFRKMAIDGYHINIDLTAIRELTSLMRRYGNNLNQYARKANETGSIYASDIEDLRMQLDKLWEGVNGILHGLAKIK